MTINNSDKLVCGHEVVCLIENENRDLVCSKCEYEHAKKLSNMPTATKEQLDGLIQMCLDTGYNEAAGLLQLGSDTISEKVRESEKCLCLEIMGDNKDCPKHGHIFGGVSFSYDDAEIKADYQERSDLYNMRMGA